MYLKQLELGPMQNFVYLVGDPKTQEAAVVDPAWNVSKILETARADGYRITHAILTHGHYDHINGVEELVQQTDATVCGFRSELEEFIPEGLGGLAIPASSFLKVVSGDTVRVGELEIALLHTPGHTPGSQCLLVNSHLIAGDTLFVGTCGRCDFPYSSPEELYKSMQKLKQLDDQTVLYPGHDYGPAPSDSMGRQKKANPFLLCQKLEDFFSIVGR